MIILIAEDEPILSGVLKRELEAAGFKVITAFNGGEALVLLRSRNERPDLLLLDILMPVMDGFQVLEEMKIDKINNLSAIPVIVLSNLGQDDEIKKAVNLGVVDYYVKSQHPISEVIEKVKNYFLESGGRSKMGMAKPASTETVSDFEEKTESEKRKLIDSTDLKIS